MRAHTEYLSFHTKNRRELVRITEQVGKIVARSGIADGFALVSAMHITAAVIVNDDEPGLHRDLARWLDRLAPPGDYEHHLTGEDNAEAHLRNLLLGHQVLMPVTAGRLDLGPWQQIFYVEQDGRRDKRVIVKVLGATA